MLGGGTDATLRGISSRTASRADGNANRRRVQLIRAAAILLDNARQYDEVGRYGGEEFAVLLPGTTLASALQTAERLRGKIAEAQVLIDEEPIRVTARFGVACYPSHSI